jgi:hypothetical protein
VKKKTSFQLQVLNTDDREGLGALDQETSNTGEQDICLPDGLQIK